MFFVLPDLIKHFLERFLKSQFWPQNRSFHPFSSLQKGQKCPFLTYFWPKIRCELSSKTAQITVKRIFWTPRPQSRFPDRFLKSHFLTSDTLFRLYVPDPRSDLKNSPRRHKNRPDDLIILTWYSDSTTPKMGKVTLIVYKTTSSSFYAQNTRLFWRFGVLRKQLSPGTWPGTPGDGQFTQLAFY